jgi:hypothetical protein
MKRTRPVENQFIQEWRGSESRVRTSKINKIEGCIRGACRGLIMVEKWINEIGRMDRSGKQNKDGVKSRKVEDGIGNVGRGRGIPVMGSRNVEPNGKSLRSLDAAGGTSDEGAGRSRDLDCRRRHKRGRREARWPLNASIFDRHTERLYWQYLDSGSESASEK